MVLVPTDLIIKTLDIVLKTGVGIIIAAMGRGLYWIYQVKTNHLPHIQEAIEETRDVAKSLPGALEQQTRALVEELREQRQDIRTLTARL